MNKKPKRSSQVAFQFFCIRMNYTQFIYLSPINMFSLSPSRIKPNIQPSFINPENSFIATQSLAERLARHSPYKSSQYFSHSPSKVTNFISDESLTSTKVAQKLIVRKLPQFNAEIREDDPLKHQKIVENINYFRQIQRRKSQTERSPRNSIEQSKVRDGQFEVSRMFVDLKRSRIPAEFIFGRSSSPSKLILGNSRATIVEGLKNTQNIFQSMIKQQASLKESNILQLGKNLPTIILPKSGDIPEEEIRFNGSL